MSSSDDHTPASLNSPGKNGTELGLPASKTLVDLPNEVIGGIFKALDGKEDISALRLTCKLLGEIGARYLVEEVHLMHLPKSYENLLKIAAHPILRKYVKRIHFEDIALHSMDFEEWERQAEILQPDDVKPDSPPSPMPPPSPSTEAQKELWNEEYDAWHSKYIVPELTDEKKDEGWSAYRNQLAEIEHYKRQGRDLMALQESFHQFPNLKEIEIQTQHIPYDLKKELRVTETTIRAFSHTLVVPGLGEEREVEDHFDEHGVRETRHLESILLAVGDGNISLKTLEADLIHWTILDEPETGSPSLFLPAFTNLRHLKLNFTHTSGLNDEPSFTDPMLGKLIRQANELETLSLNFLYTQEMTFEFRSDHEDPFQPPTWDQLALNKTWRNLKSIELIAVDMTEYHITNFMRRHASTLKTLRLSDVFLVQGTWDSTLRQFKKALHLEEVEFEGMFGVPTPSAFDPMNFPPFDPEFHLPMSNFVEGYYIRFDGREPLGKSLRKFMLEGGDDEDPLEGWGGRVLPKGVRVIHDKDLTMADFLVQH